MHHVLCGTAALGCSAPGQPRAAVPPRIKVVKLILERLLSKWTRFASSPDSARTTPVCRGGEAATPGGSAARPPPRIATIGAPDLEHAAGARAMPVVAAAPGLGVEPEARCAVGRRATR